jgi:hypothetical protein
LCTTIHAATITVYNESSDTLNVRIANNDNATLENGSFELNSGESHTFNSGIDTIGIISWRIPGVADYYYEAKIKLSNINIGAQFRIRNNGNYRYEFGIIDGTR